MKANVTDGDLRLKNVKISGWLVPKKKLSRGKNKINLDLIRDSKYFMSKLNNN